MSEHVIRGRSGMIEGEENIPGTVFHRCERKGTQLFRLGFFGRIGIIHDPTVGGAGFVWNSFVSIGASSVSIGRASVLIVSQDGWISGARITTDTAARISRVASTSQRPRARNEGGWRGRRRGSGWLCVLVFL